MSLGAVGQTERSILSLLAPAGAPASLPSPATHSTSLFPGLYLQTLHCQLLQLPRCSCRCSPLAHLSFTPSGSCHHHHRLSTPPNFCLGTPKQLLLQPQPHCPQTQGASPALERSPAPEQNPSRSTQRPPKAVSLPAAPAHSTSTSTPGNFPKSTTSRALP